MITRLVSYRVAKRSEARSDASKEDEEEAKKVPAFDASLLLSLPHRLLTRQPESVSVKL
jgi:hypothetical protein